MVTVQGAKLVVFSLVALCNVLPGVIALPAVDNISPNGRDTTFATPPIVLTTSSMDQANGNGGFTCNCGGTLQRGKDYDYCGGAHGTPLDEISCTSFPVYLKGGRDHCSYSQGVYDTFSGAWGIPGQDGKNKDDGYWVIHACDKTGVQMCDCFGQTGIYIERFGPWTNSYNPNDPTQCNHVFRGDECDWLHPATNTFPGRYPYSKDPCVDLNTCVGGAMGTYYSDHQKSYFVHPGTKNYYATYEAGWWSPDGWLDGTANEKPWCNNMVEAHQTADGTWTKRLPIDPDHANPNCMYAMLYPWVCSRQQDPAFTATSSFYWGAMTGESLFGDVPTNEVMCYADNEPWSGGHGATVAPPVWQAIKMCWDPQNAAIDAWVMCEKTASMGDGLGQCNNTPFGNKLHRQSAIGAFHPW